MPATGGTTLKVHRTIAAVSIFAITFLVFSRLIACDFTYWDDQETIHENPRLNPPTWATITYYWTTAGEHETMGLYVPVTYTVWAGLAKIARLPKPDWQGITLNAHVFHAANVAIHSLTAALVFYLLLALFDRQMPAMLGALLFALHPVQVEAVGWVSGTKDLLCGLFSMSALLLYVRSDQLLSQSIDSRDRMASHWRYLLGIALFALAILSKPTAVVVPMMAWVIGVLLLRRSAWRSTVRLLPWFVLMVPCLIWTQAVQPPTWVSPLPEWYKPLVAGDALAFYVRKILWPVHLCVDYGRNPPAVAAGRPIYFTWMVPVTIAGLLLWKRRTARPAMAAGILFLLPLLPLMGFVPFEFQVISTTADHYLYLPMLGVAVLITWICCRFNPSFGDGREGHAERFHGEGAALRAVAKRGMIWAIGILAVFAIRDVFQENTWQDTMTLFNHAIAVNPRSTPAYDGLGYLTGRDARDQVKQGHADRASVLFDQSIDYYRHSLECSPHSVPSMFNLALDYQATGQARLGIEMAHRIIDEQPNVSPGMRADDLTVADLLDRFGDFTGEVNWLTAALQRHPGDVRISIQLRKAIDHLKPPATAR